jgi:hypothetical protein
MQEFRLQGAYLSLSFFGCEGTWSKGSFTGNPEEYVKKALEMGFYVRGAPVGDHKLGLLYRGIWE